MATILGLALVVLVLTAMWLAAILVDRKISKVMAAQYAKHYNAFHADMMDEA